MSELARQIAAGDIQSDKLKKQIKALGIEDEDLTNNAVVTAAIFQGATKGNMAAVEKWEQLTEAIGADNKPFELPARVIGRAFVDINRNLLPNMTYIFKGGRGGLKSSYISLKIVELIKNYPDMHACIVRKVGATLKDSVYAKMKWAIRELGLEEEFEYKVSPLEIRYRKTGQTIYFRGADDPIKLKSIATPFGYIGILWKEERDQLAGAEEERSINQSVLRGGNVMYDFASYNPPKSKSNWVNIEERVPNENRIVHTSSYLDVPPEWLGQKFLDDAAHLKEVNPEAYEHEYMGVANGEGGLVFDYVEVRDISDEEIRNMDRLYAGVDWGYYPDYYAFILSYYNPAQETIYLIDEHCINRASNRETAAWILENHSRDIRACDYGVVCDSAEPKSVADYVDLGIFNAKEAYKPPGSVDYGMKWLQKRKIVIDPRRTPYAHKEITMYEYDRDKDGNVISGYPDRDNHCIDALRYSLSPLFMRRFTQA